MIKELIKLANHLDSRGFAKEADYLDGIIKESYVSGERAYFKDETFPEEVAQGIYELGLQKANGDHAGIITRKIEEEIKKEIKNLFKNFANPELERRKHITSTFTGEQYSNKIDSIANQIYEKLGPWITSNGEINAAAKEVVSRDNDLDPFSVKNQEKRRKERAKR